MVKRVHKSTDGKYHVKGKAYDELVGSRAKVWHKTAYKTPGGLVRDNLLMNKSGRIVSKKKHTTAKKEKRLVAHGYLTKRGVFGAFKKDTTKKTKKSRKTRRR